MEVCVLGVFELGSLMVEFNCILLYQLAVRQGPSDACTPPVSAAIDFVDLLEVWYIRLDQYLAVECRIVEGLAHTRFVVDAVEEMGVLDMLGSFCLDEDWVFQTLLVCELVEYFDSSINVFSRVILEGNRSGDVEVPPDSPGLLVDEVLDFSFERRTRDAFDDCFSLID